MTFHKHTVMSIQLPGASQNKYRRACGRARYILCNMTHKMADCLAKNKSSSKKKKKSQDCSCFCKVISWLFTSVELVWIIESNLNEIRSFCLIKIFWRCEYFLWFGNPTLSCFLFIGALYTSFILYHSSIVLCKTPFKTQEETRLTHFADHYSARSSPR